MEAENKNNKTLFTKTIIPDLENTGDTKSQSQNFNNTKYVMKWEMYWETRGKATDFNYNNNFKLGDWVEIYDNSKNIINKKGIIILGFSKINPDELKVKFKNGKEELINKNNLKKISIYDYKDDSTDFK